MVYVDNMRSCKCEDCGTNIIYQGSRRFKFCRSCARFRAKLRTMKYADSTKVCAQPNCDRFTKKTYVEFCSTHEERQRLGKDMDAPIQVNTHQIGECSVSWCDRPKETMGLCHAHYGRQQRGVVPLERPFRGKAKRAIQIEQLQEENEQLKRQIEMLESREAKQQERERLMRGGTAFGV